MRTVLDPQAREAAIDLARAFVGLWDRERLMRALDKAEPEIIEGARAQNIAEAIIHDQIRQLRDVAVAEFDRLTAAAHPGGYA